MVVSSQPIALPSVSNQDSSMNHDFIMGSYSGSVGSNFNPASFTRHFLGSPISWRAGSFGGRFPQGSPSAQLFSSLDQPSTSSSQEELINAFNVFDREGELCRDYTCCGIHLQDLHALLEHFEEVHVLVLDPNNVNTAQLQVPFNPQPGDGLHQPHHSHLQNQHQGSHHQHHQHQSSFDAADDMELELDLDNSTHPPQNQSLSPSSHSSPSSAAPNSPQHSYGHYQHATPYHSAHASPYTSQPPSPTANGISTNGLQSHQISNHMVQSGVPVGVHFPHAGPGVPTPVLANPEEAFNSYARFAADYSSHMPGAQPNASNSDEAICIIPGGNRLGDYPGFTQAGRPGIGANHADNVSYNQQQRSPQGIAPALLFASQSDGAAISTSSPPANGDLRQGSAGPSSGAQKLKLKVRGPMGLTTSASQPATPSTSTTASMLNTPLTSTAASTPAHTPPHTPLPTTTTTSLLLSKPFKCPKPNCNKSYKQANGLKYHMTHGSCNFAPSKDLEHVKDLLEMKRREKEAASSANLTRSNSLGANSSASGEAVVHPAYGDLGDITESELREVEREAEKRLRPFACGIGDCQRRYKNMNGLRYHYQHSGDHGALGLAMLAQGTHECLGNNNRDKDLNKPKSSYAGGHHVGDEREGRRRGGAPPLGAGVHRTTSTSVLAGRTGGSVSVPASRAGSVSRVGTPVSTLPSPIGPTLTTPFSPGYSANFSNGVNGSSPPLTPLTAAVQDMALRSQPHTPSGSPARGQRTSPPQPTQQIPQQQQQQQAVQQQQMNGMAAMQQHQLAYQQQFQELQRRQYLVQKQQAQFMQQQQMQSPQMQQQQYGAYGMTEQAQREYMEAQMRMMQSQSAGQQGFDQQQVEAANQQQQYGGDILMV